jgi:hypothetical protein
MFRVQEEISMVREDACECWAEGPRTQVTRFHDESHSKRAARLYSLPKKTEGRNCECVDWTGGNVTGEILVEIAVEIVGRQANPDQRSEEKQG